MSKPFHFTFIVLFVFTFFVLGIVGRDRYYNCQEQLNNLNNKNCDKKWCSSECTRRRKGIATCIKGKTFSPCYCAYHCPKP
ncbi:hypothetical protein EUTSA_v10022944mg [Eutrema salsugineum]|uniref:Knottin scorpion toxin-like domain-containing protein n=1 Tax=Eutrema salsugineum TaxID=72664 RepID=V4MDZ6_EUTSA|nr:hypothetical protein EUTSA_v10022944mg [Eutrema salsugineum]